MEGRKMEGRVENLAEFLVGVGFFPLKY